MSSDIYKERERMPASGSRRREGETRRRSTNRPPRKFDERIRKRRSRIRGVRRLVHEWRKPENEKVFWWGLLIAIVLVVSLAAVWEYWYRDRVLPMRARTQAEAPSATE